MTRRLLSAFLEGTIYDTLTYALGYDGGIVKLVFWLDGDNAEAEVKAITDSLKK